MTPHIKWIKYTQFDLDFSFKQGHYTCQVPDIYAGNKFGDKILAIKKNDFDYGHFTNSCGRTEWNYFKDRFGLVSLFNWHTNIRGLLNVKAILVEEQK